MKALEILRDLNSLLTMSVLPSAVKVAVFLSSCVLLIPVPALAGWVPMGVASDRTKIYVESNSIVRKGQYASYIRGDFYATSQDDGAKTSVMSEIVDCKSGTTKLQRAIDYDARQYVVADVRYGPNEAIGQPPLTEVLVQLSKNMSVLVRDANTMQLTKLSSHWEIA